MKTKKGIALAALLGLSLFAFTACGNGEQPATDGGETADANTPAETKGTIAYVVPSAGTPYYETGAQGAQEYGEQLGYEVVVKGPANADTAEQIQIIEDLINQGEVDAMVVACQDSSSTVPALKKAREAGIKVVTWDLDCEADGRDVYAGVMDLVEMGNYWVDSMVRTIGEEGQYAIITATMTNEFMNSRIENMKAYAAENYPGLELLTVESCDADPQKAYQIAQDLITAYPDMKCILTVSTEAYTSAAKVVEDEGKVGQIYVAGGVTPSLAKSAFESGAAEESVLWDPGKWAGFAVTIADQLLQGKTFETGVNPELPGFEDAEVISPDVLYYHEMMTFTKDNVDDYDF